jgi:inner membrane protein
MPSVFSHAIAAVAIGGAVVGGPSRLTIWTLGAICAVVPDLDVVSFHLGLPYGHMLGHRGLSHSLPFAAAFLAPFSDTRYFSPWRPIVVSPIGIGEFFGPRGVQVMWSELGWVWVPSAVVFLASRLSKRATVARHRAREEQP